MAQTTEKTGAGRKYAIAEPPLNFKEEMERERKAREAKTARLRTLRLAKEAQDREEAARLAALNPAPAKKKRTRKAAASQVGSRG